MEELDKFKIKAPHYRQALAEYPRARLLELYPVLWYLEKCCASIGKPKQKLKIVDLMSGSGFLSNNLFDLGYTSLHSIEFCEEMYKDSSAYFSKSILHSLSSFDHLEGVLDEICPDVIVSLASFHHLIAYDSKGNIDNCASIDFQSKIIDICMRTLPEHGILLIIDLIEDNVTETPLEPFKISMKKSASFLEKLGVKKNITDLLKQSNSVRSTSSILQRGLGARPRNNSLYWFRNIVDNNTTLGHSDIALSRELIKRISDYQSVITKYRCPWIFENEEALKEFIYKKFAFVLDEKKDESLSKNEVVEIAKKSLGVCRNHGVTALGWDLGIILLSKSNPFSQDTTFALYIKSLLFMAIVLVAAILLRLFLNIYGQFNAQSILVFFFTLPIGIIFGNLLGKKGKSTD